jgi:DNA processing protein
MIQKTPQPYWLALTHIPRFGGATLRRLLKRFDSVKKFIDPSISLEQISIELEQLNQAGITLLTWDDADYPNCLYALSSPPPVLFVRGSLQPTDFDDRTIAIVGSRQVSHRSLATTYRLAENLANAGFTIISGLALGIDSAAHHGALATTTGRTVAILGSGIQRIYPHQNIELAQLISQRGIILSEQRPTAPPEPTNLMARNRLIAASSQAVIVVEATSTSGALATARWAGKLKRRVFAYPGSPGTTALLQAGAIPLTWNMSNIDMVVAHLNEPVESNTPFVWKQERFF